MAKFITYGGKKYRIRELVIKSKEIYPDGQAVRVAPEALIDAMDKKTGSEFDHEKFGAKEQNIDDSIYHYVQNSEINLPAKELAKRLDEPFTLVKEDD